jgi:hypothetical protein
MKKTTIALLVTALLGALSPGLPAIAHPLKTPHENPATARESATDYNYLTTFSSLIDLAVASQYRSAGEQLDELHHAGLPPGVSDVLDQYRGLYRQLFKSLDNLKSQLNEVSSLLARNRIDEARLLLDAAGGAVEEAGFLVKDLQAATDSLDEELGAVSRLLPDDPLAQACDQLQKDVVQLDKIVGGFQALEQDLNRRYTRLTGLAPVEVSLEVSPARAFVGDPVTAYGRLNSRGSPLPGRTVAIVADDVTLAKAVTADDGSFTVPFAIPYKYADGTAFSAVYEPAGEDAATYLGALSQPFMIATEYYASQLTASFPETVYPGHQFTLGGEVTAGGDPAGRELLVALHGENIIDVTVSGRFSLEITPPPSMPSGIDEMTVTVLPQGRYEGVSVTGSVTTAIMNPRLLVELPPIILLPHTVQVRGVFFNGPIAVVGAPVNIHTGRWNAAVVTGADGTFRAEVPINMIPTAAPMTYNPFYIGSVSDLRPFNISPLGWQDLRISAEVPGSPFDPFEIKKRIVSFNPLAIVFFTGTLAAAWFFVYRRRVKTASLAPPTVEDVIPAPPLAPPLPAPLPRLTGLRGKVLAAYRSGRTAVEKSAGVAMGPDNTLREFLNKAPLPSPAARETFTKLTDIAESTLYSRVGPRREMAARAEELALNIKEDLAGGAA